MIWKKAIIPRPSAIELIKHKTANNNEENNLESVPNAESPSALQITKCSEQIAFPLN
jgi:hypothetical protein